MRVFSLLRTLRPAKKLIRPLQALLIISSFGCSEVPRPNTDVCILNAPLRQRRCFNLKDDYNEDGELIPGHLGVIRPNLSIEDLNKAALLDSPYDDDHPNPNHFEDGLARLKSYVRELRAEMKTKK